jgi:hypothetical protein
MPTLQWLSKAEDTRLVHLVAINKRDTGTTIWDNIVPHMPGRSRLDLQYRYSYLKKTNRIQELMSGNPRAFAPQGGVMVTSMHSMQKSGPARSQQISATPSDYIAGEPHNSGMQIGDLGVPMQQQNIYGPVWDQSDPLSVGQRPSPLTYGTTLVDRSGYSSYSAYIMNRQHQTGRPISDEAHPLAMPSMQTSVAQREQPPYMDHEALNSSRGHGDRRSDLVSFDNGDDDDFGEYESAPVPHRRRRSESFGYGDRDLNSFPPAYGYDGVIDEGYVPDPRSKLLDPDSDDEEPDEDLTQTRMPAAQEYGVVPVRTQDGMQNLSITSDPQPYGHDSLRGYPRGRDRFTTPANPMTASSSMSNTVRAALTGGSRRRPDDDRSRSPARSERPNSDRNNAAKMQERRADPARLSREQRAKKTSDDENVASRDYIRRPQPKLAPNTGKSQTRAAPKKRGSRRDDPDGDYFPSN